MLNVLRRLRRIYKQLTKYYITIRPRYLTNDYHDTVELFVHVNFEMLRRFLDDERDWIAQIDWTEHEVDGRCVLDIMSELRTWYETVYMPYFRHETQDVLCADCPVPLSYVNDDGRFDPQFNTEEDRHKYYDCASRVMSLDLRMYNETQRNLKLLVDCRLYMWT